MKFPDSLSVRVLDRLTRAPVEGLAIVLELFALRKNNYIVGPAISDQAGEVQFTREECKRTIKSDQEMFIMDYEGDLEDCRPNLEVRLHAPEHINAMVRQYKSSPQFWGRRFQDAVRLFAALEKVKNDAFEPARIIANEVELLKAPQVLLLVRRKSNEAIWKSLETRKG